jgi:hypothetical protein
MVATIGNLAFLIVAVTAFYSEHWHLGVSGQGGLFVTIFMTSRCCARSGLRTLEVIFIDMSKQNAYVYSMSMERSLPCSRQDAYACSQRVRAF